jgi:hypothetical protein
MHNFPGKNELIFSILGVRSNSTSKLEESTSFTFFQPIFDTFECIFRLLGRFSTPPYSRNGWGYLENIPTVMISH